MRKEHSLEYEEQQRVLDPHREEEQERTRLEAEARLGTRHIQVNRNDDNESVANLLDAIERFEAAVERRGGDLMINQIGTSEPENPDFVPPAREPGEQIRDYTRRVERARQKIEEGGAR